MPTIAAVVAAAQASTAIIHRRGGTLDKHKAVLMNRIVPPAYLTAARSPSSTAVRQRERHTRKSQLSACRGVDALTGANSMRKMLASSMMAAAVMFGAANALLAQPRDKQEPPIAAAPNAAAAAVPVKAVVLFSSGVGYFEHYGSVKGGGSTELRFKTQQINDILKSLILQDLDGGKVSAVTYPSQDPITKALRSFQVDITSNPSLGDLLNQLRGAKVKVSVGAENAEGTILGLEKRPKPAGADKQTVEVWHLNLITGGTIRSVELDQVTKLELEDKTLQQELARALEALAQSRDQDKKPVTINFTGDGERRVRLGYVVETPVWKTSYRLILGDKPALQGWAIVENQTDNDWNEVQLSLVSGRPISFIQDLYQPLYVPRPVVQPQLFASLRPQTYEGGINEAKDFARFREVAENAPAAPAPAGAMSAGGGRAAGRSLAAARAGVQAADKLAEVEVLAKQMDATSSVSSVASAAKLGELFQYTVGSVSLPRQKSAMIPIITDPVEVERLSIYNQNVLAKHPLTGARVKNTTGKHLLAGPVTVLDGASYAGDASIDNVPPGQERLVSYGVDLEVIVDATKNKSDSAIQTGSIVKGVLHLKRKNVFQQEYQAENKGDKDKTLIVEHPIRQGWKLVDTDKPIETTESLYRFKGKVASNKATKLTVKEEVIQGEELAILPMDLGALDWYSRQGEIPKDVREVLAKAITMRNAVVDTQRQIEDRRQRVAQITAEQNRMRENMKTVRQGSEYYNRLMSKLDSQETQIEGLQTEAEQLQKALEKEQRDLEQYLASTTVG
jgi:hypothetical protein